MTNKRKPDAADRADLLYGLGTIARFIGVTEDEGRQLAENGTISTFTIGTMICARKSLLRVWLAERANAALPAGGGQSDG